MIRSTPFTAIKKLVMVVSLIAIVWLGVLPWLSSIPAIEEHISRNRAAGIDAGAVFYTEHPAARDWNRSIEHRIMTNENAFWEVR